MPPSLNPPATGPARPGPSWIGESSSCRAPPRTRSSPSADYVAQSGVRSRPRAQREVRGEGHRAQTRRPPRRQNCTRAAVSVDDHGVAARREGEGRRRVGNVAVAGDLGPFVCITAALGGRPGAGAHHGTDVADGHGHARGRGRRSGGGGGSGRLHVLRDELAGVPVVLLTGDHEAEAGAEQELELQIVELLS
jgi:hypothetical protein